jgi:hypothetical protein
MPAPPMTPDAIVAMVRVIQAALTPAFILAGLATLISALSVRLGRVSDRVDRLADQGWPDRKLARRLRVRSMLLDAATVAGSLGGVTLCFSVFALFLAALSNGNAAGWAYGLFLAALAFVILALSLFIAEVMRAGHDLRVATRR